MGPAAGATMIISVCEPNFLFDALTQTVSMDLRFSSERGRGAMTPLLHGAVAFCTMTIGIMTFSVMYLVQLY
jgi:hypothetical protein